MVSHPAENTAELVGKMMGVAGGGRNRRGFDLLGLIFWPETSHSRAVGYPVACSEVS